MRTTNGSVVTFDRSRRIYCIRRERSTFHAQTLIFRSPTFVTFPRNKTHDYATSIIRGRHFEVSRCAPAFFQCRLATTTTITSLLDLVLLAVLAALRPAGFFAFNVFLPPDSCLKGGPERPPW